MKILITGGVGFIGTNASIYFASKKHDLLLVDDFSRPGVRKNAFYLQSKYPAIKIIKSNVKEIKNYDHFLKKADAIIHLAGQTAVTRSIEDPKFDFENNLAASFYLLEFIRQHNPQAIVLYSSTNKVYGDLAHHRLRLERKKKQYHNLTAPNGIKENESLNFISPYGCSKGAVDQYFHDYARIYALNTVVLRQSCIYGKFQMGVEDQGWVAHFAKQILTDQKITIFGDGYQLRDLLFVDDLIEAYDKLLNKITTVRGEVFNIGGGIKNAYSLINVIALLEKVLNKQAKLKFEKARSGDQKYFVSDNAKINQAITWKAKTTLRQGLKLLIDWQKQFLLKN
ncbi:MAG: NAD-dependent epimerase/dehydratase family protein [Candidatus Woesebacteria bacterium]|jgi:CDP-paratose 2-epimerase